ncbi:unnamed protein product [Hyaloperonospora brassicae]|uniref:Uncharacterized protein n=1 Tax=Hyaloperonospora brassicae TaxID=162125 RepID=A0AAV0UXQ7_HYABA|nr:unnamed protein product [Hyaloperonospora brassicae]
MNAVSSGRQRGAMCGSSDTPVTGDAITRGGTFDHADWNMISANSFDETYLEGDYTTGGMSLGSSSSSSGLNHINEPMNKLTLDSEDHDMPVISMPYPGTNWFMGDKTESGTGNATPLPSFGGLTPRTQAVCAAVAGNSAAFSSSSCTPNFHSGGADYSSTTERIVGDAVSSTSDAAYPARMQNFAPCLPHNMEPSELLFEDMNTWTGTSADVYDNHHYNQQHAQPLFPVPTNSSAANGYAYFEDASNAPNCTVPSSHLAHAPPYQRHPLLPNVSTGSPIYRPTQGHEESFPTNGNWTPNQAFHHSTPVTCMMPRVTVKSFGVHADANSHGNRQENASESIFPTDKRQATKHLQPPSTLSKPTNNGRLATTNAVPKAMASSSSNGVATYQSVKIQLLTALNDCYWKNGRKNLQCFPSCPEHHDFYSMKMNNRKHSSVGVCRGPVYCQAFTNASEFLPAASTQQMKRHSDLGVSRRSGNAREVFVLGRFERVPQQESTNLLEELNAPPSFSNAAVFEQFRFTCFQAVEMEERRVLLPQSPHDPSTETTASHNLPSNSSDGLAFTQQQLIRSTWFFLPDVWKVQPMLKKKRKATRSAPAQTFPFCFRIFIYTRDLDGPGYSCIADTASTFFELYSTRTVDRVKRKYWSGDSSSRGTTSQSASQPHGHQRF